MIFKTTIQMKHEREQLLHQIDCIEREIIEFNRRGFSFYLTEIQIETLAVWTLSPADWNLEKLKEFHENWWNFPTKLSDMLQLASENNLPPKTFKAYKEWEAKNQSWVKDLTTK